MNKTQKRRFTACLSSGKNIVLTALAILSTNNTKIPDFVPFMHDSHDTIPALYAGELTPTEAFALLQQHTSAQLVDVRTVPEWTFVGYPDLIGTGKKIIQISWRFYPTMQLNHEFGKQLRELVPDQSAPLFFLCRTGGRSLDAAIAMTAQGYTSCYNVTAGFEGDRDRTNQRGRHNGWKAEQLPWRQD